MSGNKRKKFTRIDEEKRLCQAWLDEPLINPSTGMPIERKGPTYQFWQGKCTRLGMSDKPPSTGKMTWRKRAMMFSSTNTKDEHHGPVFTDSVKPT